MNTSSSHPLWLRLTAFRFDSESAALTFTARLARENNWSAAFAEQVVEEYRKFLFLTQVAGHACTPSEAVDQAWHLHMVYTRSYWEDLCTGVLQRPLHHDPTSGGAVEGQKFEDWYARTLESYRQAFGHEPPTDVWPAAERRFATEPRWVDARTHWILPKPRCLPKPRLRSGLACLGIVLGTWGLSSCLASSSSGRVGSLHGPSLAETVSQIAAQLSFSLGVLWIIRCRLAARRMRPSHQPPLTTYQLCYLKGRYPLTCEAMFAKLYGLGYATMTCRRRQSPLVGKGSETPQPGDLDAMEQMGYSLLRNGTWESWVAAMRRPLLAFEPGLINQGWLVTRKTRREQLMVALLLLWALPALLATQFMPMLPLILLSIFCFVVLLVVGNVLLPRKAKEADAVFKAAKAKQRRPSGSISPQEMPAAVYFYGLDILPAIGMGEVQEALRESNKADTSSGCSSSTGSGCGSSDGGSGGGSGCSSGCGGGGCGGGGGD